MSEVNEKSNSEQGLKGVCFAQITKNIKGWYSVNYTLKK